MLDERSKFAVVWATLFLAVLPLTIFPLIWNAFANRPLCKKGLSWSSYAKIGMLAVTSTLIGGLSISAQEHGSGPYRAAMSLQAVLGFLVGVSVMDLGRPASRDAFSKLCGKLISSLYTVSLSVVLFCATLLTLITPLLPERAVRDTSVLRFLSPALFLAFTLLALSRIIIQKIASPSSNTQGVHTTITFPDIQSRGASPAFNANFGFDPGAQHQSAALRTFRFPPLPAHEAANMNVRSSFRSFMPSPDTSQQQRLTPIPATPSNASATSTSTSRSRQNNNSGTGSRTAGWMESLHSLRSQVSLGALRAREVVAGTNCKPITIHVATQRSSFTHAREPGGGGPEAGVAVGVPELGRRVVHGWIRDARGNMSDEEAGNTDSVTMRYPPRLVVQGHHLDYDRRHASTISRASEASTSESHGQQPGTKAAGTELKYPSTPTPAEPDVEQQYRQSAHCDVHDQWNAKHNDMYLAHEHDIDVESTDGGCNHSKHGSLAGAQAQAAKFAQRIDINAGSGYAEQRVAHVALPAIRSAANLGSRFSVGDDLVSINSRRHWYARRGLGVCLLGAQVASAAAWGWALGAALTSGQSSSNLRTAEILRTGQAACMMLATVGTILAYFLHRDSYDHDAYSPGRLVHASTKASRSGQKARSGGMTPTFGNATPPAFDTPQTFSGPEPMFADAGPLSSNTFSNGIAAMVQDRAVITDTVLHAAFPSSANYDYIKNEANDSGNRAGRLRGPLLPATESNRVQDYSDHEEPVGYTPPPGSFPKTLSIPQARKAYSGVQISAPPSPIERRRRGVGVTTNSLLPTPRNTIGDSVEWVANNATENMRDDEGEMLKPTYSDHLEAKAEDNMDAEEDRGARRTLLGRSSTTAERTRQHHMSAEYRQPSTGIQSPVYRRVDMGNNGGTRHRKHATDDPSTYIRKRGSVPPPAAGRKLLGWDWGREGPKKGKDGNVMEEQGQETSFIDLHGRAGGGRAKEGPKGQRQSLLSGIVSLASSGTRNVENAPELGRSASIVRKLRKKSKPHMSVEPMPASPTSPPASPDSPESLTGYFGRLGHRTLRTSSPGAQATNYEALQTENASPHIIQLKRSFRLGVGRTMGPSLTLAVAEQPEEEMTPAMRERQRYYNSQRQKEEAAAREKREVEEAERDGLDSGEGNVAEVDESTTDGTDGDEEEIQLIAAAKLVSASIARATPAATILTAPSTPIKAGFRTSYSSTYTGTASPTHDTVVKSHLRPVLANLSTVGGALSPQSSLSPTSSGGRTPGTGRASWKPHPFADAVEELVSPSPVEPVKEEVQVRELIERKSDDDLVQLEREMEERNRQTDNAKTLLDLNDYTHPGATGANQSDLQVNHSLLTGRTQARQTLSSPPVSKSDWTPKASTSVSPSHANFSNFFPIIFGASASASPRSGSPSAVPTKPYQQSVSSSTPGTPRSGSNIRLPSKTMDTVRTVFAGVSARMSSATSRMSVTSAIAKTPRGAHGQIPHNETFSAADDVDRDFMDLRDPFAPTPPAATTVPLTLSSVSTRPWDNFLVIDSYGVDDAGVGGEKGTRTRRRRMSAWGRLPLSARTLSPVPSSAGAPITTMVVGKRASGNKGAHRLSRVKVGTRRAKKERRTRKVTLSGTAAVQTSAKAASDSRSDDEFDNDFGLDEALLSQRLLRRLNSTEWELEWDGKA